MRCPNCGQAARMRASRQITSLVRELRYQCENIAEGVECGLTFRAELAITHQLSPSAKPRPGFGLPSLRPRPDNDNARPAAASV